VDECVSLDEHINVDECVSLDEHINVDECVSLDEHINVDECVSLDEHINVDECVSLVEHINVDECVSLVEHINVDECVSLDEHINLDKCVSLNEEDQERVSLDEEDQECVSSYEEDQEDPLNYCEGGYHRVLIGDCYHSRYIVARKLGWGTFSTVWLCWDVLGKQYVALKVLKSATVYTENALDEIDILKTASDCDMNDPNRKKIVQLLDYFMISGVNGTHMCLVFEVLGLNLRKLIFESNYRGIPLANVKSIIRQILEGLNYLHTKCEIVHADIKPENILICVDQTYIKRLASQKIELHERCLPLPASMIHTAAKNPLEPHSDPVLQECDVDVKIADLGNAFWVDHRFKVHMQTQPYRSLEVILGADYGTSADIWSTACLAFELATGHCMFQPRPGKYYTLDEDHLASISWLLGKIPRKIATSAKRNSLFGLRHNKRRKSSRLYEILTEQFQWDHVQAEEFTAFLLPMLDFNPNRRATDAECLMHPWLN
jgi:serine/threonine protein kinase